MTESPLFNFVKPLLDYIDKGEFFKKPIRILYVILAIVTVLAPIVVLFTTRFSFKNFIFFLVYAAASLLAAQIWWIRGRQIGTDSIKKGDEFIATPVIAHLIQTFGEVYGVLIAIAGSASLFLDISGGMMGLFLPGGGWYMGFFMPIVGFIIVLIFRFLAEQIKALAAIANNTRG